MAEADRYVKSHPGEMAPQLIAARALDLAGQHDQAATRLEAVVRSAPDSLAPRVMLGRAYESANKLAEAERVWQEATAKFPEIEGLVFDLALCREKRKDLDGAEAAVRDVLGREPSNPTALNFLGYLLADHDRKLDEAVDLIQRALALDPNNGAGPTTVRAGSPTPASSSSAPSSSPMIRSSTSIWVTSTRRCASTTWPGPSIV